MTSHFVIHEAKAGQVDEILDLMAYITGLSPERERAIVHAAVAARDCLVSIDSSERVTGYVVLARLAFFGRDFVPRLAVAKDTRRQGVATALLTGALERCTTNTVFTSTNESNAAMRSLLARDAWTVSGTLTGIDEGDPELVFWKRPERAAKA